MDNVFIGVPAKGGILPHCTMSAMNGNARTDKEAPETRVEFSMGGVDVAHECNALWCMALKQKINKYNLWALHHSDIEAPYGWLNVMIEEMETSEADILSAIVSIKDGRGISSCCVCNYNQPSRRLTLKQAHALPATFSIDDVPNTDGFLGINTGLVLIRFDKAVEWTRQGFCFHIDNRIEENDAEEFFPKVMPEDWGLGEWAYTRGLKVFCTTKLTVKHWIDNYPFDNSPWGLEQDPGETF